MTHHVDDQVARWARREPLLALLSRATRGVLLPEEGALLRAAVDTELAAAERAERQRDDARRIAVALENQLAAVRGLHVDSITASGVVRFNPDTGGDTAYCTHDSQNWPCATIRAIEEQP
ncbi:hypothetical protein [Streptomyces albus]|uniref:hypothetical protein n=1 Tax=Streptomyces albus TaxID=1888 RepID=UPI0033C357F9